MKRLKVLMFLTCYLLCCQCLEAAWSSPTRLSSRNAQHPQLAMNTNGFTVAAWQEFDGTQTKLVSASLPKNGSWSAPALIASYPSKDSLIAPQIAIDSTGNAVAIWEKCTIDKGNEHHHLGFPASFWRLVECSNSSLYRPNRFSRAPASCYESLRHRYSNLAAAECKQGDQIEKLYAAIRRQLGCAYRSGLHRRSIQSAHRCR